MIHTLLAELPSIPIEWWAAILLQLPIAAIIGVAFIRGWVHSDAELKRREAEHLAQITYVDERRREERDDRLAAEARLERLTEAVEKSEELMASIEREVIRSGTR